MATECAVDRHFFLFFRWCRALFGLDCRCVLVSLVARCALVCICGLTSNVVPFLLSSNVPVFSTLSVVSSLSLSDSSSSD